MPSCAWLAVECACRNLRLEIPTRLPNQPRPRLGEHCQGVLCAGKCFFIIIIHRCSGWFSCPKPGTILRKQNPKSPPQRRAALSSQTAAVARNGLTALAARPLFSMRLAGVFFHDLNGLQLHHPGTVLQLIARMHGRVIRLLVADHGGDDFEPAHAQAAQRAGMALAFFPVGFVIDARPVAIVPAQIYPQVNGVQKPANPGLSGVALVVLNETGTLV